MSKKTLLDDYTSKELLNQLLEIEDGYWIYDSITDSQIKKEIQHSVINDRHYFNSELISDLKETLKDINILVFPTDNVKDLMKAEFILENWDKISENNINI